MSTIKTFREMEEKDKNRADKSECILERTELIFENKHGSWNTNRFISIIDRKYDTCNALCMYKLWKDYIDEELFIDIKNNSFGKYCILIYDIKEFLSRIVKHQKIQTNEYVCHYSEVKYIDENVSFKNSDEVMVPFTKLNRFAHQREFRVIIDTKLEVDKFYIHDIGDLTDISINTTLEKINSELKRISLQNK